MHTMVLRAAVLANTDISSQMKTGFDQFIEKSGIDQGSIGTLLKVIGGAVLLICVGLLVLRKWAPNTQIGQSIQQGVGGAALVAVIAGLVVGVLLIAPKTVGGFLVQVGGKFAGFVLDIFAKIFGFSY